MKLQAHGSLGDEVMLTGLPEAYFKTTGNYLEVTGNKRQILWKNNPYIKPSDGNTFSYSFNTPPKDYMIYYPVRIFYDITGSIVSRDLVQPNLYINRSPEESLIVVNDEAGWPSRRGYIHFDSLCMHLLTLGYRIHYTRGENLDCMGRCSPNAIHHYSTKDSKLSLEKVVELLSRASFYIGYDSGLAQICGALKVPYILISSAIPPINTAHNSCIYAVDVCSHCIQEHCTNNCLHTNKNTEIIEAIRSY